MKMLPAPIRKKRIRCHKYTRNINKARNTILYVLLFCVLTYKGAAQSVPVKLEVPDWALPGSASHKQVPPPPGFHRPSRTENKRIGIFDGQSDIGAALVPGSATFNLATGQYTINSAGYNIWYTRDEFRYVWKKMSGDISLSANVKFPDTTGFSHRKVVLIIRQSLDDDSKEAMVALHGGGLMHLAWRPEKGESMKEMRVDPRGAPRIGIEKHGDTFTFYLSTAGEPMQMFGDPVQLHIDEPFYVGLGFCSHLPDKVDTGIFSNVTLENAAGNMH